MKKYNNQKFWLAPYLTLGGHLQWVLKSQTSMTLEGVGEVSDDIRSFFVAMTHWLAHVTNGGDTTLEIHPCFAISEDGEVVAYSESPILESEPMSEREELAACWTVYGKHPMGGVYSLLDYPTKSIAEGSASILIQWAKQQQENRQ